MATVKKNQDVEFSALAIYAKENALKGSRQFWWQSLNALGEYLRPDLPPTHQKRAALEDPRGQAFAEAMQQCP